MDIRKDLSFIVITCDKNQDLKNAIARSSDYLIREGVPGFLVSETEPFMIPGMVDVCPGKTSFVERMQTALKDYCQTKCVLVLLDDYHIHDEGLSAKLKTWLLQMEQNDYSALRVSKQTRHYQKSKKQEDGSRLLVKPQVYSIDFHPTIWKRDVLISLLEGPAKTPWELEPFFAKRMTKENRNVGYAKPLLNYDELVVRGRFFRKPFAKYVSADYTGTREVMGRWNSFTYHLKTGIYHWTPRWAINFIGKILHKKSYSRVKGE